MSQELSFEDILNDFANDRALLVSSSIISGSDTQVSVCGWNTGVDPSSSRYKHRNVGLRSSAISWSDF